jgi:hypothetical protein
MRISLNNLQLLERFLFRQLEPEDSLVMEAQVLTNPALQKEVRVLEKVFSIIRTYHRSKVKAELEVVHRRLFNDPAKEDFKYTILELFKK